MKKTLKVLVAVIVLAIIVSLTLIACSGKNNTNTIKQSSEAQIVLDALLDPDKVYSDDRIYEFGNEAYNITTNYIKNHDPDREVYGAKKWQLPDGYVLEVRADRSVCLTTFPIGGRKTSDPEIFETRNLWTNIDTGDIEIQSNSWYAVAESDVTFIIDCIARDTYEVVALRYGEKVGKFPIEINDIYQAGFVNSDKNGCFHYGVDQPHYGDQHKGVFFENANELYVCYELNGEYKAALIANDYTGSFAGAASSIFYIDEQANLIQVDVYGDMDKIEKHTIARNVYSLNGYGEEITWREIGSNETFKPEHYVLLNEKVPFGWGA